MTDERVTTTFAITCSSLDKLSPPALGLQPLIQFQGEKFPLVPKPLCSHGYLSWGVWIPVPSLLLSPTTPSPNPSSCFPKTPPTSASALFPMLKIHAMGFVPLKRITRGLTKPG